MTPISLTRVIRDRRDRTFTADASMSARRLIEVSDDEETSVYFFTDPLQKPESAGRGLRCCGED